MLNGLAIAYQNLEALGLKPGVFGGEDKQAELEVKREGEAIKCELSCLRRPRNVSATSGALSAGLFLLPQRDQPSHSL